MGSKISSTEIEKNAQKWSQDAIKAVNEICFVALGDDSNICFYFFSPDLSTDIKWFMIMHWWFIMRNRPTSAYKNT